MPVSLDELADIAEAKGEVLWGEVHENSKTIYHGKQSFMDTYVAAFIHGYKHGESDCHERYKREDERI